MGSLPWQRSGYCRSRPRTSNSKIQQPVFTLSRYCQRILRGKTDVIIRLLLLFFAAHGICAQSPRRYSFEEEGLTLSVQPSLEEYVNFALHKNAELQAFYQRYLAAEQRIRRARSLQDPTFRITHFTEAIETRTGPQRSQISLSQTLPWMGKLNAREAIAADESESQWWQFTATALSLTRKVEVAYHELAYLRKWIAITRENLALLEQVVPIAEERVRTGGDLNSLLRLQVEAGKAEDRLQSLERKRPVLEAKFNALLNRDALAGISFPERLEEAVDVFGETAEWGEVRRGNPTLIDLQHRRGAEDGRLHLARLDRFPDISLGITYLATGETSVPGTTRSGQDPFGISVAFNLPIWPRKNRASELEVQNMKMAVDAQIRDAENHLRATYKEIRESLIDDIRRIRLYRHELLPKARQAVELTASDYRSGRSSLLEFIDSQRSLLDLEMIYWRAVTDYRINRSNLKSLYVEE